MQVHEKRMLLEAIDILVTRPAMGDETTLGNAIGYLAKLVEEMTDGEFTILCVEKNKVT